jgi:hypothetical protein
MALPPIVAELKEKLEKTGYAKRTSHQDKLLEELEKLDGITLQKGIEESANFSTRMTGTGSTCPCCGR